MKGRPLQIMVGGVFIFTAVISSIYVMSRKLKFDTYESARWFPANGNITISNSAWYLEQDDILWHYLVSPRRKLMWCKMYKTASSQISNLFRRLEGDPDWRQFAGPNQNFTRSRKGCAWLKRKRADEFPIQGRSPLEETCDGIPDELMTVHQYHPLKSNATSLVKSSEFDSIVMVRDPYDRFISAVADKCMRAYSLSKSTPHCPVDLDNVPYRLKSDTSQMSESREGPLREWAYLALDAMEKTQRRYPHDWYTRIDDHFRPQSTYCGLHKGVRANRYVHYDALHMGTIMNLLFAEIGIAGLNDGWGSDKKDTLFADYAALSPQKNPQKRDAHRTMWDTDSIQRARRVFDSNGAVRVDRLFAIDYATFTFLTPLSVSLTW